MYIHLQSCSVCIRGDGANKGKRPATKLVFYITILIDYFAPCTSRYCTICGRFAL